MKPELKEALRNIWRDNNANPEKSMQAAYALGSEAANNRIAELEAELFEAANNPNYVYKPQSK